LVLCESEECYGLLVLCEECAKIAIELAGAN
jgi:hypothetical protein